MCKCKGLFKFLGYLPISMGGVVLRGIPPGGITAPHPNQTGKQENRPRIQNGTKAATISNYLIM